MSPATSWRKRRSCKTEADTAWCHSGGAQAPWVCNAIDPTRRFSAVNGAFRDPARNRCYLPKEMTVIPGEGFWFK